MPHMCMDGPDIYTETALTGSPVPFQLHSTQTVPIKCTYRRPA